MSKYVPPLSFYISKSAIPGNFGVFETGLDNLFSKLYVENLTVKRNSVGGDVFYSFNLLSKEKLAIKIPGTKDMSLVFNPSFTTGNTSVFPMSFRYRWNILELINDFKLNNFSFSLEAFYNIILKVVEVSNKELLSSLIRMNTTEEDSQDPISDFVVSFNTINNPTTPLVTPTNQDFEANIDDLITQIESNNYTVTEAVFTADLNTSENTNDFFNRLQNLFEEYIGRIGIDDIKSLILPDFSLSLNNLSMGIEFPETIFQPVDPNISKALITFNVGSLYFDRDSGFSFQNESSFSFTKSKILNTGFTLEINQMKLDLSRKNNIPEAIADNRPDDFMGVYITQGSIGFPSFLNHDDTNSNAELFVNNLLVGTGGISGTIGLKLKNGQSGTPKIKVNIGGFELNINTFSLTFRQNAIVGSDIKAEMTLPWFKDENDNSFKLDVLVHFEQNGELNITAIPELPIRALKQDGVFTLSINSFSVGSKNDRYFIKVSGDLSFENINSSVGNFLSSAVSVKELIIWDDSKIEFKGGFNPLPKSVNLQLGPAKISVTNIHLGQDQRTFNGELINYNFFGFDAALSLDPGGLDLRGDGIKLYYAFDPSDGRYIDAFMRIQGINIDLYIPASVSRERASVIIKGYLRLKNDPNGIEEYQGGIDFSMPDKGIAASAAMAYKPKVPSFLVDASLTLATPLVLGATGLGIYGFRGIFGRRYVPSKTKIGLTEDARWWEFYKKDYNGGGHIEGQPTGNFAARAELYFGNRVANYLWEKAAEKFEKEDRNATEYFNKLEETHRLMRFYFLPLWLEFLPIHNDYTSYEVRKYLKGNLSYNNSKVPSHFKKL